MLGLSRFVLRAVRQLATFSPKAGELRQTQNFRRPTSTSPTLLSTLFESLTGPRPRRPYCRSSMPMTGGRSIVDTIRIRLLGLAR
jgi:hypothetical protein